MTTVEQVLSSLRAHPDYEEEQADGMWLMVYLDNARVAGMNDKAFRAALAQLSKQGLYKVVDGYAWGKVKA